MSQKPETKFRTKVVDPFLKTLKNCYAESIQQISIRGTSDKKLCINGWYVALELKSLDGKLSPLQQFKLNEVIRTGGIAIACNPNNWEATKELLTAIDKGEGKWKR